MAKTTYLSCEENGMAGAERIAAEYRSKGYDVRIEHGDIPQWGSAIPSSSTFGKTEPVYRIIVDDHRKPSKRYIW